MSDRLQPNKAQTRALHAGRSASRKDKEEGIHFSVIQLFIHFARHCFFACAYP